MEASWLGRIDFASALELQERIVHEPAGFRETLLLLEHDPVYTTGRGGKPENLLGLARPDAATPVFRIGRGGDVTYHGPGQLVGYALVDLRARGGDVHRFLRSLEDGVIAVLDAFCIASGRSPGQTGVWVSGPRGGDRRSGAMPAALDTPARRKIASIGIGVRRGRSMHGFALNVAPDLAAFAAIVPCGIAGVEMTSMAAEGIVPVPSVEQVAAIAARVVPLALDRAAAALDAHAAEAAR